MRLVHHLQEFICRGTSDRLHLLAGCDIRVRLVVAVAAIVAVVFSSHIWFGLAALGCCVTGLALLRTSWRAFLCRLPGPLALAAVVFLLRAFTTGQTPLLQLDLGPWQLTATQEGVLAGGLIAARILGCLGIVLVLCQGTPAQELFAALRWARFPRTWIEIALLMYRYLHVLFEQALGVLTAQKVRLGYSSLRRSLHSMGTLAGAVLLRSLDQVEKSHEAMLARGYQGALPLPALPPLTRPQAALGCGGVALIAVACFLAERWPL